MVTTYMGAAGTILILRPFIFSNWYIGRSPSILRRVDRTGEFEVSGRSRRMEGSPLATYNNKNLKFSE